MGDTHFREGKERGRRGGREEDERPLNMADLWSMRTD